MLGWNDIGPAPVQEAAPAANLLSLGGKCQEMESGVRWQPYLLPWYDIVNQAVRVSP